jgi:predicted ATPase
VTGVQTCALPIWGIYQHFDTGPKAPVRQSAVSRYEARVAWDAENLVHVLHTLYSENRDFKRDFDLAMQAAFDKEFEELTFPPVASNRIELRVRWRNLRNARPSVDLSDGTLRFMHLITILADPNPPPLIAIDEPETGLHPRMLPLVAEYAASAALRTQVILTTHSAEFLDAFRDNPPTTTVAELVNGETKLRVLPREELDYWLKEYTLGDIYRSGQLESAE